MAPAIDQPAALENDRVRLRPLADRDLEAWVQGFADDPRLGVMLGTEQDPDLEAMEGAPERQAERAAEGRGAEFVIADPASDAFLGAVNLFAVDWHSRRAEIGLWLAPRARGSGIASAALTLLLDWAFEALELDRVEMTTTPENAELPRLAARLGFRQEGVLRSRNLERGRRVDIIFFGLLRSEWPPAPAG